MIVSLVEQNATEVTVVGDVLNGANKFKVRFNGDRVLDMISKAGGTKFPGYELFVTLQRGGKRVRAAQEIREADEQRPIGHARGPSGS